MSCVSNSPSKRLKTQIEEDPNHHLNLRQSSEDSQSVSCGICYADDGVSIRGEIDSCNHYFCFVCIMEWAKHESRCPICRQRFSSVRRPPKPGVFPSSRLVKVPLRDQVYHVHGNMTTGPVDPYAEVQCSVCDGREDEHFLLLCDLCDMASHTYCVGLGYTVPEGDWFCHDCTVSRGANDNNEIDHQCDMPTAESSVTVLDIVREPNTQVIRIPRTSSVVLLPDRVNRNKNKSHDSDARTLHRCRHVQRSIQALRENWNALRSGSLRFHSNSIDGTYGQKQDSDSLSHGKSDQPRSLASTNLQQSTIQVVPSSSTLHDRGLQDVQKAWKMMDKAKMMQKTCGSRGAGARKVLSIHCNYQELKNQQSSKSTRVEKQYNYSSLNKDLDNYCPPNLAEQKDNRVTCEETTQYSRDHTSHSEGYCEPPLPRKIHTRIPGAPCHEIGERNFAKKQTRSSCLVASVGSGSSDGKFGNVSSSSKEVGEKKRLAKSLGDGNAGKSEDAKNEIKSLVKLNLKVLSKDKRLDVDTFKEVARQSTHTILAACRSEHQKSDIDSSGSLCSHTDDIQRFHKSTLMPNCCRQCFYFFVKNVVNCIMMEKVGCARSS